MNKREVPPTTSDKTAILLQPTGEEDASLQVGSGLKSEKEETGDSCDKGSDRLYSAKKHYKKIGFLNIHCLYNKLDQLQSILCSYGFHVFALNETFLNKSYQDNELKIPGYNLIRNDRLGKGGGGVAVYVDHNTPYVRHPEFEFDEIEEVWIEIYLPCRNVLLCTLYRPPDSGDEWFNHFGKMMRKPSHCFEDIIIIGDFNIDLKKPCKIEWKKIIDFYKLVQMVTEATRKTEKSGTLIDHVYTTNVKTVQDVTVLHIRLSDHYPVSFMLQFVDRENESGRHKSIIYRSLNTIDMYQFKEDLDNCSWDHVFSEKDTDMALKQWQYTFINKLNEQAPLKRKVIQQKYQPIWFNYEIKEAIRMRDSTQSEELTQYRKRRDEVNKLVKNSKKKFFKGQIKTAKGDTEAIRLVLRKLLSNATTLQNQSDPVCLLFNDKKSV